MGDLDPHRDTLLLLRISLLAEDLVEENFERNESRCAAFVERGEDCQRTKLTPIAAVAYFASAIYGYTTESSCRSKLSASSNGDPKGS